VSARARARGMWVGLVTLVYLVAGGRPAAADNCQTFTDCFATADAGSDALLGLTFLGMLSMAINFIPYVGTAKGVIEAVTGEDLLTGQQLSTTDRLLGLIPGGVGRGTRFADLGRFAGSADEMAGLARSTRYGDDVYDASRAYRVGEHNVASHGRGPFRNQMAGPDNARLNRELAEADAAGIRPITPDADDFDEVINGGRIKWAVTTDGELRVIPHTVAGHGEVPHSVLTRGDDVLAAGEADIAGTRGSYFGVEITPHSGHFRPSLESLEAAREAFARFGITFP
jgi:hypothetical protein